jgi:hypothetical protein
MPVTAAQTDDQARFRLAQLAPGTYYLSAWPRREFRRREFLDAKGEPIREREVETYYGGSLSIQEATPIMLKAGQQISRLTLSLQKAGDIDGIVVQPLQLFDLAVRVRVEGATRGSKVPPISQLFLSGDSTHGSRGELQPDGTYKFESVPPGVHQIEVATEGDSCL